MISAIPVQRGRIYWLAVLGEGGTLDLRHGRRGRCYELTSSSPSLGRMPAAWTRGVRSRQCPVSAYVTGTISTGTSPGTAQPTNTASAGPNQTSVNGPLDVAPTNLTGPVISGSAVQGQTLTTSNGSWSGSPTSYAYQWQDCTSTGCTNITGATSSSYTLQATDVGDTIDVIVTASNSAGSASQRSAQTGTVTSGSAAVVGWQGAPTPSCSTVVSAGADPSSALASASAEQTVCLADGTWSSGITISHALGQGSPGVTLAAQHPGKASVAGVSITVNTQNLTVEGLSMNGGFSLTANLTNDSFLYNTMENWTGGQNASAVYAYPGPSGVDSGVKVEYNQIDHAPQCLQIDQPTSITGQANWTFSHNVCGPDIGNGNTGAHYLQAECVDGITVDNNAFEGPANSGAISAGSHFNVLHSCGSNLDYENNIQWHDDAVAQALLIGDDGQVTGLTVKNNLDVMDPGYCTGLYNGCPSVAIWVDVCSTCTAPTSVMINNNTAYNSAAPPTGVVSGGIWAARSNETNDVTAQNNLMATQGNDGDLAITTPNTLSGNVVGDTSGGAAITHWSPCWQDTSWPGTNVINGPNNGSPWVPPPANYFKPLASGGCANHGVTNAAGYQGTIGP